MSNTAPSSADPVVVFPLNLYIKTPPIDTIKINILHAVKWYSIQAAILNNVWWKTLLRKYI